MIKNNGDVDWVSCDHSQTRITVRIEFRKERVGIAAESKGEKEGCYGDGWLMWGWTEKQGEGFCARLGFSYMLHERRYELNLKLFENIATLQNWDQNWYQYMTHYYKNIQNYKYSNIVWIFNKKNCNTYYVLSSFLKYLLYYSC